MKPPQSIRPSPDEPESLQKRMNASFLSDFQRDTQRLHGKDKEFNKSLSAANREFANKCLDDAQKSLTLLTESGRNLGRATRNAVNRAREAISEAETLLANACDC